jgi:hypothetical protein
VRVASKQAQGDNDRDALPSHNLGMAEKWPRPMARGFGRVARVTQGHRAWIGWALMLLFAAALRLGAIEVRLIDGTSLTGEILTADKDGFVLKLEGGGYSPKTDWGRLADESLLALSNHAKAGRFVQPYVTMPTPEDVKKERKPFKVAEPQRVGNPAVGKGALAAILTPGGMFFIGLMYAANIFFGFEVARFRWRSPALVCGLSAVLPVVGPLIYLAMPKWTPPEEVNATAEAMAATTLQVADSGPSLVQQMGLRTGGGGVQGNSDLPRTFGKGEFTFNRRFFETQFGMFLPSAQASEAEGLVMEIVGASGPVVANKINRMNASEVIVQRVDGEEAPLDYGVIQSVTLRAA